MSARAIVRGFVAELRDKVATGKTVMRIHLRQGEGLADALDEVLRDLESAEDEARASAERASLD